MHGHASHSEIFCEKLHRDRSERSTSLEVGDGWKSEIHFVCGNAQVDEPMGFWRTCLSRPDYMHGRTATNSRCHREMNNQHFR